MRMSKAPFVGRPKNGKALPDYTEKTEDCS